MQLFTASEALMADNEQRFVQSSSAALSRLHVRRIRRHGHVLARGQGRLARRWRPVRAVAERLRGGHLWRLQAPQRIGRVVGEVGAGGGAVAAVRGRWRRRAVAGSRAGHAGRRHDASRGEGRRRRVGEAEAGLWRRAERVEVGPGERLRARPRVVGGVAAVEARVVERLHQASELRPKGALERLQMPLPLPPLGAAVLEPDLRREGVASCRSSIFFLCFEISADSNDFARERLLTEKLRIVTNLPNSV